VNHKATYRLGYVPTEEDKAAEVDGRKREEGLAPYPKTLNGNFFKREGSNFPLCGFPEPWYDPRSGKWYPELEVFADVEVNWVVELEVPVQLVLVDQNFH
jgi:hypothetical protein